MSALMDCIETVLEMSRLGGLRSLGGYSDVLKSVFTRVDLPSPDSPAGPLAIELQPACSEVVRTDYHDIEVETLAHALAVPLVGQVREADISCEFPANNVPHVARSLGRDFRVFGGDCLGSLRVSISHGTKASVDERRSVNALWDRRGGTRGSHRGYAGGRCHTSLA